MDFVGFAALGGLERVTIVAGAIIIGYWGYRLYAGEKKAGVIFMGLAVLVLVGALATGNSYLRSVGEGLQLASAPEPEAPPLPEASPAVTVDAEAPAPAAPQRPETAAAPEDAPAPAPHAEPAAPEAPPDDATATAIAAQPTTEAGPASPARLATGQELGGRIVSVKSANVSLEWSASDSD